MSSDYIIELTRTGGPLYQDKHVRGIMVVKQGGGELVRFRTLERGLNFTNLKVGTYEMKHSIKRTGRQIPCLRPTNPWISAVLIHDAYGDKASNLLGCIAPFAEGDDSYYRGSEKAMNILWQKLGGFDPNTPKKVTLIVTNNYPGEHRTAEQWIAQRREAALKQAAAARLLHGS